MNDEMVRMMQLAQQGFHCSQMLLILGLEAQGKENADLVRSVTALAGGIGFTGDVCGALTGGACLLGLYAGRGTPEEEDDPRLNVMISQLVEWFSGECAIYGGMRCSEITGDDPSVRLTRCPGLVHGIWERVKALLIENDFDLASGRE
ncbi:MAG: DVU_1555 family C-GCAxxG-C-C protein [Syntrophobacteraceae bacterium]